MSLLALIVVAAASTVLGDPAQEARAQSLEREIRCVQCQNEPIAQSTADIAADMRALVRERIAAGDSDAEIRGFFRQRYGDFVLFRPPWDARTWMLWATPILLLGGGLVAVSALRRRRGPEADELTPEESER
jgi:cytochrome c-type biogenesis protein CcmH